MRVGGAGFVVRAILAVAMAGCQPASNFVPYIPDPGVKGITRDRAKTVLTEILTVKARTQQGRRLVESRVEDRAFRFTWHDPFRDAPRTAELVYADVTTSIMRYDPQTKVRDKENKIVPIGGEYQVSFQRSDGGDLPDAFFYVPTLEDAQTVADAVEALATPPAPAR